MHVPHWKREQSHPMDNLASIRYRGIATGGPALQPSCGRLASVRAAWSVCSAQDCGPQSAVDHELALRAVRATRVARRLGKQSVPQRGCRAVVGIDPRGCGGHSWLLAASAGPWARDFRRRLQSAPQARSWSLLSEGWLSACRIYEGRSMGIPIAAGRHACASSFHMSDRGGEA